MGTITLPNNPGTIQNTQVTDATKVMENFTAIVAECNGSLDADNLAALAVETAKIANLAVTAAKLATDAVETLKIKDANVTLAKMAANSVDSDQYVDGSIDLAHMSAESVDSDQYVDGSIDLAHMSAESVDSDQYVDGSIDLIHMSAESVDSDQYVDGSIDTVHLAADAVDDTKIGDAKIKKEHINADIVGTGLAGGAGTALSVDGIVEIGASVELKCKVIEIGTWNMDTTANITVAHGLADHEKVRMIKVLIRHDSSVTLRDLHYTNDFTELEGKYTIDDTNINLYRRGPGTFDSTDFDTMGDDGNRGWITLWYEA